MHQGYVKLWRKSIKSGWLKDHKLWVLWCWCLIKATHQPIKILVGLKEVHLEPGQFIFGRKKASEELKMSEKEIRLRLIFLEKAQNVAIKRTNRFSIITIINWDSYQQQEPIEGQHNGQQGANKGPTKGHKQEHKEHKNIKNKEKNLFVEGDEPLRLSEYLFSKIQENNPKAKNANLQVWAKQIDLMLRVDNRTPDDIQAVIDWCQDDDFWKINILSTDKLRKQFDKLYLKMTQKPKEARDGFTEFRAMYKANGEIL
jgi:hypothetical protein